MISRILAKRLQLFIQKVVQPNQVGFVKGRLLCENLLLASELVSDFHKDGLTTRGCLKIDLTKAFDNVNWDFIINLLTAFELPARFIGWLKECFTTPSYSISFNGDLAGYFQGKKGLRQGDPISSYLFVIAMDILSKKLDIAVSQGLIRPHPLCVDPAISHLSFADDVLIFFDGSEASLQGVLQTIDEFHSASGLGINLLKTSLLLDGNNSSLTHSFATTYGLEHGSLPVRYLGLPLLPHKLRETDYQPLIERIRNKLTSWTVWV